VVGATGTITMTIGAGGPASPSGVYQVMTISETQDLDNANEYTISLRKNPS